MQFESKSKSQSPVVLFVEFLDQILSGNDAAREHRAIAAAYCGFLLLSAAVLHQCSDRDFSAVLTAGSGIQCFGFFLLLQKIRVQHSVKGVSRRSVEMYLLVLACRLCSTLVKHGYLPVDRSGDYVYQIADACSVCFLIQILYCIHKTHADTYQAEHDSLEIWRAIPACAIFALALHGDLNHSFFFDSMWTMSMNVETVAMLPQLWTLCMRGGEVEGLTANYVAANFLNACCRASFWWYGHAEIGKAETSWYFVAAGYWVVIAHILQVLLSADFMYHYFQHACGLTQKFVLPSSI